MICVNFHKFSCLSLSTIQISRIVSKAVRSCGHPRLNDTQPNSQGIGIPAPEALHVLKVLSYVDASQDLLIKSLEKPIPKQFLDPISKFVKFKTCPEWSTIFVLATTVVATI